MFGLLSLGGELGIRIKRSVNCRVDCKTRRGPDYLKGFAMQKHRQTKSANPNWRKKRTYKGSFFGGELGIRTPGSSHFNGFQVFPNKHHQRLDKII